MIVKHEAFLATASRASLEKDEGIEKISQEWENVQKLWEEVKNKNKNLVQDIQNERDKSQKRDLEIMKVSNK